MTLQSIREEKVAVEHGGISLCFMSAGGGDTASVAWESHEARYHFWCDLPDLKPIAATGARGVPTLYKSSLKTKLGERVQPVKRLDAEAAVNVAMIAKATEIINREGLVAKLHAARAELAARLEAENARLVTLVVRRQRFGSRGGNLLNVLKAIASNPTSADVLAAAAVAAAEVEQATPEDKATWEELS